MIVDDALRCVVFEELLALSEPGQRLARVAELREDPGGGGDWMGKGEDDIPRPVRRDPCSISERAFAQSPLWRWSQPAVRWA